MKSDFNAYLNNSTWEIFSDITLCFNLTLTDGTAQFPVPTGTFIIHDKLINILMPNGNLLPVEQMHQLFFKNNEDLDYYIKNIIGLVQHQKAL